MRYMLVLLIAVSLHAASPFETPEVNKAKADVIAAQHCYAAALEAAWIANGPKPIHYEIPADPRKSDEEKYKYVEEYNKDIVHFQNCFKRWHDLQDKQDSPTQFAQLVGDMDRGASWLNRVNAKLESLGLLADTKAQKEEADHSKAKPKIKATLADGTNVEGSP